MSVRDELQRLSSDQLRALLSGTRHPGRLNIIHSVLDERENAHQEAFDATQLVLDVIGGQEAPDLHARAIGATMRHAEVKDWLEAERAKGVADALWDYIRERSDT